MNETTLAGKTVAILVTDGFEQSELEQPRRALHDAGAATHLVSPKTNCVRAWDERGFGAEYRVDVFLGEADPHRYDALLLPGGVINCDRLRVEPDAMIFVRSFFAYGKPIAATGHGPQMLIEADVVRDRKLTCSSSLRRDVINGGGLWLDEDVVIDRGLVTGHTPADLPKFIARMITEIAEGIHPERSVDDLRAAIGGGTPGSDGGNFGRLPARASAEMRPRF